MTFSYTTAASWPQIRPFVALQSYVADHDDNTETKMNKDLPAALQFRRLIFHAYNLPIKVSNSQQVPQMVNPKTCRPT